MIVEKLIDYGRSFYTLLRERRKAERSDFPCNIVVSCKNRYGQLTTYACNCLNVSDQGLGFISTGAIPENSDIYIHSETHNLKQFARVRYCSPRGDRNYIGCCFQPAPDYWN